LAYIEESQGQFDRAARFYQLVLRNLPDTGEQSQLSLKSFYQKRYAATLERAGYYTTAEKLYWELYDSAELPGKIIFLPQIIANYSFQDVTAQQMTKLHEQVVSLNINTLGWGLADLYRIQGDFRKSHEIYETIWRNNANKAVENLLSMIEVFQETGEIDAWLEDVLKQEPQPAYLPLSIELLKSLNRSEDALQRLEDYFLSRLQMDSINDAGDLVKVVNNSLLIVWIELIEQIQGIEPAMERTRQIVNRNAMEQLQGIESAMERTRQIVNRNPADAAWRNRLSNFYARSNQTEEAVKMWKDWFEKNSGNPSIQIRSAEKIHHLGDTTAAYELFQQMDQTVAPQFAFLEAKSALELGLFDHAIASYNIAAISAKVQPAALEASIMSYAGLVHDVNPLMASLVRSVSGKDYAAIPSWLRDSLVEIGTQFGLEQELEDAIGQDTQGIWHVLIAKAAQKYGKTAWAKRLLEAVPENSVLHNTAQREMVSIISLNPSIPSQKQAAELLRSSIAPILDTTYQHIVTAQQLEQLFAYTDYCINAYEPGEALLAVRAIESSTPFRQKQLLATQLDRISYARSRILAGLGSFKPALEKLQAVSYQPYASEAQLLKAKILLVQREVETANAILHILAAEKQNWQAANNALSLIVALEPLVGESVENFCVLQAYLLQGKYETAFPLLRELAVAYYGEDTEEWARYTIGELKARSGDREGAIEEWKRLLLDVDHPVYHGMIRYQFTRMQPAASGEVTSVSQYQQLLLNFPDSLFSDLARLEAEEYTKGLTP